MVVVPNAVNQVSLATRRRQIWLENTWQNESVRVPSKLMFFVFELLELLGPRLPLRADAGTILNYSSHPKIEKLPKLAFLLSKVYLRFSRE